MAKRKSTPTLASLRKLAKRKGLAIEIRKEPFVGCEEVELWWDDELTLFITFHAGMNQMAKCVSAALSALPDVPTKRGHHA